MPFPSIQASNAFPVDLGAGDVVLADILPPVYGKSANLFVSNADDSTCVVDVVMADAEIGTEVTYRVPSGTFLPVYVKAVADSSTADTILAVVAKTSLR